MKTLGLLGGVASGKSLVSGQLATMGALILNADRAGHEALRMPEIEAAARQRWVVRYLTVRGILTEQNLQRSSSPRRRTGRENEDIWKP